MDYISSILFRKQPKTDRIENMSVPTTAIIIGAGSRGTGYAEYASFCPEKLKVIGVAEPRDFYRNQLQSKHEISPEYSVKDWRCFVSHEKLADAAFICTQDQDHKEPAIAFARLGYHIFLEKPMAVTEDDCKEIVRVCSEEKVTLAVGHVLRYTPPAIKIKQLIDSGIIGEVINIQLLEPVGFWHFAHSYVRGNWRNAETSSFSLLAKSCHDIDLICYWLGDRICTSISSFGSLKHFSPKNKPVGASDRCMDCQVERDCAYSAKKIYLDPTKQGARGFPMKIITEVPDIENIENALKTGPYGRCVYSCDNNVMDNQVVNLQFDDGVTVSFTMVAYTKRVCERQVRIFGTKGELSCSFDDGFINHFDFVTRETIHHQTVNSEECRNSGMKTHGGADFYAVQAFISGISTGDASRIMTGPVESLRSHLLCFAAEQARIENKVLSPNL